MELAKMGARDLLTLIFVISTIASSAVAGAYTYNYYQFYPALRTVELKVYSFAYNPANTSLNAQAVFTIDNPSSYSGLTMTNVLASFDITPPGGSPIPQGLILYELRHNVALTPGKIASLSMFFNGSGREPQIVYNMIQSHQANQSQFIFNYRVEVYLSTFMDTYASVIILFACTTQGTIGECQQGEIALATTGPSNTGGGGGGL
jgi:hypothetical protein